MLDHLPLSEVLRDEIKRWRRRAGIDGDHVVVSVRDDGHGAAASSSAAATVGGFGIPGMTERVHALAGTLTVEPSPAGGTLVHAVIPATARLEAAGA